MNCLRIARRNLLALFRDRAGAVWTVVMPLAFCALFGVAFARDEKPASYIQVIDRDGGFLARDFIEGLRGEGMWIEVAGSKDTPHEAKRRIVLEEGFTDAILMGEERRIPIADWPMANEFDLAARFQVYRSIVKVLGHLTAANQRSPGNVSEAVYEDIAAMEAVVKVEVLEPYGHPTPSGFRHTVPSMLVMFVMMNTLIYGGIVLALDRTMGRLARVASTPTRPWEIVGGHVLGAMLIASTQTLLFIITGPLLFGISWGASPLALLLVLFAFVFCCACFAIFLGSICEKEAHVIAIGPVLVMIMAALGGCWWPLEIVPDAVRWLAYAVPTGWAVDGIHRVASYGMGVDAILKNVAVMIGFGLPFVLFGVQRIRRSVT